MSRYQDTVIDDDEETCPLCIEEFDLSDRNFKPCPCGYQICQFCFNSLKTTYEKSTCPNCRRPYDEATIQYKIPTAEELKLDQLNKNKKLAAAKRKETEKREVETSNRRNLAGVRVKQQNLVYVIGLEPSKRDEATLMETLRGKDYFGQYGPIEKIVVSKPKPGAINQGVGVYVTFKNKEDAAKCIACVDNSPNGERTLRAQYGTTKYCSTFLRGDVCQNKNCSFLHETGEDGQNTSLQNEPIESKIQNPPHRSQPTPQPAATSQPMGRENSREGATSRQGSADGSALPPTAGWANPPAARARRASQATSTSSPLLVHAAVVTKKQEPAKQPEPVQSPPAIVPSSSPSTVSSQQSSPVSATKSEPLPIDPAEIIFQHLRKTITSTNCAFQFDDSSLSDEVKAIIAIMPPLFDPYGGAKRRIMQDREAEARAKLEAEDKQRLEEQAKSAAEEALDEDNMAAGSLALGGEPEEHPRSASARGAIGQPLHQATAANIPIDQLSNLNLNRSLTPRQQRQLAMLNAGSVPHSLASQPPAQNTAFEMSDFDRRAPQYSQAQYDQISSHARHGSRYFNNESKANNARFPSQQPQQPYFSSGVQGPPPGLPTAGTPPISGGGMFAHGQGFASSGFGATKDPNAEALRTRSGTNAGHDAKRGGVEHLAADPSILSARIHQGAGGQGLFGGNQVDQDFPLPPKRTESQSAIHSRVSSIQSGNAFRAGTPKVPPGFERTSTPKIPPGLESLHAHPTLSDRTDSPIKSSPKKEGPTMPIVPVVPAVPVIPLIHRQSSLRNEPKIDRVETLPSTEPEPVKEEAEEVDIDVEPEVELYPPTQEESEVETKPADQEGSPVNIPTQAIVQKEPEQEPNTDTIDTADENTKADASTVEASPPKSPEPVLVEEVKQSVVLEDDVVGTPAIMSRAATPPLRNKVEAKRPTLRTLNVTSEMVEQFRRTESGAPPSTTTERSFALPTLSQIRRQNSRQPSISTSRPSTPGLSERLMSQDVSRAGSPPPSLVGSAPVRQKNTAQKKKERKAKKVTETSDAGSVAAAPTPPTEEVGPIVARQKKQKKQKTASTTEEPIRKEVEQKIEPPTEDFKPASPVKKVPTKKEPEKVIEKVPTPRNETPPPMPEPQKPPYKLRDFYTDAAKLQAQYNGDETITDEQLSKSIQDLLTSHISPLPKLLSEMIASGDLAKDHPLFSPPSFSSAAYKLASDNRKGQAYLDGNNYNPSDTFGYVYLPQKEKKALYHGHAVSVADSGNRKNDLLRRCLITPGGWVLRHLSAEESEKVLDLEERRGLYLEEFGDLGVMDKLGALEDNDYINLEGGFEELSRYGERHGVMWVVGENEQNERGRRARYGRTGTIEDDYGLGDMPVDGDELLDDDQLDDDEDDDELEGEEMVLEAEVDEDGQLIDEEGDDLGFVDLADAPGLSLPPLPNMPGGWDPTFNSSHSMYGGLGTYPPYPSELDMPLPPPPTNVNLSQANQAAYNRATNTLPPLGGQYARHAGNTVNLRAMDIDVLQKRVGDKQKEAESARKDAERQEKALAKKGKDHARWRDSVLKGVQELKG